MPVQNEHENRLAKQPIVSMDQKDFILLKHFLRRLLIRTAGCCIGIKAFMYIYIVIKRFVESIAAVTAFLFENI